MKTTTILKIIFHFYIASLLVISPFFLIIGESDPEDTLFTMDENSERYVSPEAKSEAIGKNVDGKVDLAKTRGSVRAEPEDPVWVEISDGLWEVSWNFTSSAAYVLDSVVLNNGTA